jgi:glycosyltransferase involved in cell wall biosynthesis
MASIIIADNTGQYDGRSLETKPLGGTESMVILCARELAKLGHEVTVHSHCDAEIVDHGVRWRPLSATPAETCDAYVAVQHPSLLGYVPRPRQRVLWALWGVNQWRHYKQFWRLWRYRPTPILMSQIQVRDYWPTLPRPDGPLSVIPLPMREDVRGLPPLQAPPPRRAIFASNPARNLCGLVEIWAERILPRAPGAVLDVYGVHDLRAHQDPWQAWEGTKLPPGMSEAVKASVKVWPTAPRADLLAAMRRSRAMLYLGHKCEAFCLSLAEAQALGTPVVVAPVAVLPERLVDGVTGYCHADPAAFADSAVALLTDDGLWRRQHETALRLQQGISVAEYGRRFEAALFGAGAGADRRAAA